MLTRTRAHRSQSIHCWLCLALGLIFTVAAYGQDQPPAAANNPGAGDLKAQWEQVERQRQAVVTELQRIQKAFPQAEPEEQEQLKQQFQQLAVQYEQTVFPAVKSLAPKVFAADPSNLQAGQVAMSIAFEENRYEDSAELAQKLVQAGDESPVVKNMLGVSYFATHEFNKARQVLAEAEQNEELIPQLGGHYLDAAGEYEKLWEAEQEVRQAEAQAPPDQQLPQAVLRTTKGEITIELFENQAPNTVANFVSLIENDNYDNTAFHRVIPGFMVQGGDPNSLDKDPANDGQGGPGYTIDCECYRPDARMHFRGSLSMAHAGKDTGGSQFFITHLPTAHLNPDPAQETGHTVFGRVIKGMDVVAAIEKGDRITDAKVTRKRNHGYEPKTNPEPTNE